MAMILQTMLKIPFPRKKATASSKANETTHIPAPTTLRTSAEALIRLLWDPVIGKHGGDEYAVGYEDRFLSIKDWRLNSLSLNCLYFKRASDGEIMWDKRKRIDVVFGSSGVGAG
ncbi:MAG: hypothetical protein NXY57DRAFT_1094263 [Lentinula lateritia]|uniref:MJ1316 RNA cyclic group end recognition domain-containing protein n=1 Tax=Lentinula lateritia TaxID=40482 RepID=A0ABQ8V6K7_9AGAR|nr:MAG: hypothetical protein NXY57DRAFT_1094263 [Lentinula lateritia]KAJ4476830.1 hypothetical protein C8R41DRAFT_923256 [Lentinula lateritia]